jgi:ATP-dependent Clp protease adaptor protein ClpS
MPSLPDGVVPVKVFKVSNLTESNFTLRAESKPQTITTPDIDREVFNKLCPPYKVILYNDDVHSFDFVIGALMKSVPSLKEQDAEEITFTADSEGTAVVIVVPQETAEYYQERILSFGLGCTIEPDE